MSREHGRAASRKDAALLVAGVVAAELFTMVGFSTFAATLPELSALWRLDPTQAGWISSAYNIGYVLAVPVLMGLTDRVDTRKVYAGAAALGIAGGVGFAAFASGFASALVFRAIAGAALAGTYMPGLRLLTERLAGPARLRVVPYYTAAFGVGVSASFLASGWLVSQAGWRTAFAISGAAALVAIGLAMFGTARVPRIDATTRVDASTRHPLDFRCVFSNSEAMRYIAGYFGHCWELFAFRAWLTAFVLFALGSPAAGGGMATANHWATWIVLVGVPASIVGAEAGSRAGRVRLVRVVAGASVLVGAACGLASGQTTAVAIALLFAYNVFIAADSGALTTGAVASARDGEQGATLAVHSIVGFVGASIGPLVVGWVLDRTGGLHDASAWTWAFVAMTTGSLIALVAMYSRRAAA